MSFPKSAAYTKEKWFYYCGAAEGKWHDNFPLHEAKIQERVTVFFLMPRSNKKHFYVTSNQVIFFVGLVHIMLTVVSL